MSFLCISQIIWMISAITIVDRMHSRTGFSLNLKFTALTEDNFSLSWGEEQHLGFVVLPKLKNVGAMLDSTYPTAKTREEQQQMPPKVLFYHSTKNIPQPLRAQNTKQPLPKN